MNYEEKYKQALKRAKTILELTNNPEEANGYVYTIFPELRESEDKKIRKSILELVKQSSHILNPMNQKSMISWLEKQGEQKPIIIIPKFKVGDIIKPKPYNEEHLIKDINENGYVLDADIIIPFKDEDVWEIVKQNPSWSEEDERMLGKCIDAASGYYSLEDKQNIKDWLRAIKDRIQPQPKQEWNEEDERMLKSIIYCIDGTPLLDSDQIDWLKSLKPRWKPTENQISMLLAVVNDGNNANSESCHIVLKSLYNDLKSL